MKKIAVVTGGSRGIGRAIVIRLAQAGYQVVFTFIKDELAAKEVVSVTRTSGNLAMSIRVDLASAEDIGLLFSKVKQLGRLDLLVNNAGILEAQTNLLGLSLDRLRRVYTINVFAPILCSQLAVPFLRQSGGGIINISSIAAKTGSANEYIDYAGSKGAIDSITVGMAKELAADGIRVNAVRPGMINTQIHASGGESDRVSRLASSVPLGRGGEPSEVADVVEWLASDCASYCTGSIVDVSGGL